MNNMSGKYILHTHVHNQLFSLVLNDVGYYAHISLMATWTKFEKKYKWCSAFMLLNVTPVCYFVFMRAFFFLLYHLFHCFGYSHISSHFLVYTHRASCLSQFYFSLQTAYDKISDALVVFQTNAVRWLKTTSTEPQCSECSSNHLTILWKIYTIAYGNSRLTQRH